MVGLRYGGSSITNGVSSSLNKVLRKNSAVIHAIVIPNTYNPKRAILACFGKNAPTNSMYTGKRALHDMNGTINIVIMRLLLLSIVRVAIIAGTLQPNPIISGMKDLPWRPILCINLSMIKAALDIYPESSINDMKR